MLKIRFQRTGKKNKPNFRLVLINSIKAPKSGSFLEILGYYDPVSKKLDFKKERISELQKKGAVISETALKLIKKVKLKWDFIKSCKKNKICYYFNKEKVNGR